MYTVNVVYSRGMLALLFMGLIEGKEQGDIKVSLPLPPFGMPAFS